MNRAVFSSGNFAVHFAHSLEPGHADLLHTGASARSQAVLLGQIRWIYRAPTLIIRMIRASFVPVLPPRFPALPVPIHPPIG